MSEQDMKAAATVEAKSAAAEFLSNFKTFKDDMSKRMNDVSTRVEALDRKSAGGVRPALATAAIEDLPHRKAISAYVRQGSDEALRALSVEAKGLNTAVSSEGGFLVDPKTADTIEHVLRSGASLRSLARVVQIDAGAFDVLVDHNELGADWVAESASVTESQAPIIDRISIPLHELSASPTASQRLLDDAAFDIETWLAERIAERFLRRESEAFVSGDGVGKPSGFLNKPQVADASWAWGSIGYVATGTAGDFDAVNPGDSLVDLIYALNADYRAGAAFVMNSKTAGMVRKLKDSNGRFLWLDGLRTAEPALLVGYPVVIVENMPDIANNAHAIAFGNFSKGYTIAERPDLRILRDPYSAKPNVMFYATKRVGGDVTDFAAIKTLKFGSS